MRVLVMLAVVFTAWSTAAEQLPGKTLTLATAQDWKPYVYINAQGNAAGTDYVLLRQTLQQLGITLNNVSLPEQRLALRIAQGTVGVILGAALTSERQAHNYFSIPYRQETIVVGFKPSRYSEYSTASIAEILADGKFVALNKSGWFGETLSIELINQYQSNIVHAEGTSRRLQLLMLDRVDAVVGDIDVLMTAAQELGINDFAVSTIPVNQTDVHFMFGHKQVDAGFMAEFNQTLATFITPVR